MSTSGHGAVRHATLAILVIATVAGAVLVSRLMRRVGPPPAHEDCENLVARYLTQSEQQKHPSVRADELARAVETARLEPTHAADVALCRERLTKAEVQCGLRANWVDELERCIQ
ncbi:MAG: hypothetical protein EXR75_04990 [Myxococcales bacterium]|nr:hypothetical protein [Myxococcales bacterium]